MAQPCLLLSLQALALGAAGSPYYWPSAHGPVGSHGWSNVSARRDISSPSWSWRSPGERWATLPVGTAIDDERNIYLFRVEALSKFSPGGTELWRYERPPQLSEDFEGFCHAGALYDGAVYLESNKGRAVAVDMRTGKERWSSKIGVDAVENYGQVAAHDGVMITSVNRTRHWFMGGGADTKLVGLSTQNGSLLWTFEPTAPIWTLAVSFPGDGTFVFQDVEGRTYRNHIKDGTVIWKRGGFENSWCDGMSTVGPNGVVYSTANSGSGFYPSDLHRLFAYNLSDGALLWQASPEKPPNGMPVVGRLAGRSGLSVVLPLGAQCHQCLRVDVHAYDAETGKLQWVFEGPRLRGIYVPGDIEGAQVRGLFRLPTMTMPHPWGNAAIDALGKVYVHCQTGHFFALEDSGQHRPKVVSFFETGATGVGCSGPALAPGMMALAVIDAMHVWQWPTSGDLIDDAPGPTWVDSDAIALAQLLFRSLSPLLLAGCVVKLRCRSRFWIASMCIVACGVGAVRSEFGCLPSVLSGALRMLMARG